jgi:hypothetical protein
MSSEGDGISRSVYGAIIGNIKLVSVIPFFIPICTILDIPFVGSSFSWFTNHIFVNHQLGLYLQFCAPCNMLFL